jgi:hypothetical protein
LSLSAPDTVLILTHSGDQYVVERVGAGLERRGLHWIRFDTDLYPSRIGLEWRLGEQGSSAALCLPTAPVEGQESTLTRLPLERVRAVWARKLWRAALPQEVDPRLVDGCQREIRAALLGSLGMLRSRPWINPLDATARAEDKLLQLRLAREFGLNPPRTLVSNQPAVVREFRRAVGPLVAKLLTPLSIAMHQAPLRVHTNRLSDQDLEQLDGLAVCPMVFQEEIHKQLELRVAYVDGQCFTGAIDASSSAAGQTDWRRSAPQEVRWQPHELPKALAEQLAAFMRALELPFGALDLILTPAGRYVFLEVNPSGEWGMLERDLGLPIAEALAAALVSRSAPSPRGP